MAPVIDPIAEAPYGGRTKSLNCDRSKAVVWLWAAGARDILCFADADLGFIAAGSLLLSFTMPI